MLLRAVVISTIFAIRAFSGTMFATVCDTRSSVPCDLESSEAVATALNAAASSTLADAWSLPELYTPEKTEELFSWQAEARGSAFVRPDKSGLTFALNSPLATGPARAQEMDERREPGEGTLALLLLFVIILGTGVGNRWRAGLP